MHSNGSRDDCPESVTERVSEKSRGEEQLRSSWRERGRQGYIAIVRILGASGFLRFLPL